MQQGVGKRLVFFPSPLQGHLTPMFQLATMLHAKSFSISFVHTQINAPNPDNHTNFTFHAIPDGLSDHEASLKDVVALTNTLNINCVGPLRDCLSQIMLSSDASQESIACLITDAVWHFSQAVADSLNIPRIVLRTSGVSAFLALSALPSLKEKGYLSSQDMEAPLPELPPLRVKDIPRVNTRDPDSHNYLHLKMSEGIKASQGLIFNSFEELEGSALAIVQQEFRVPVFLLGPFHKAIPASSSSLLTPDQSCISWLNTQAPKSVLYVSFGSIAAIDETQFLEIGWGLANSDQAFLWVVRPGLVRGSEGADSLPDELIVTVGSRGHIVKWAPQLEVLSHPAIKGFWTHNGWNSTLESICEGVPMICMPFYGDQMVNARYVTDVWKVGLRLEGALERGKVEKVIRALMTGKECEDIIGRIASLKEKANLCIVGGGSSYKSLESLVSQLLSI